MPIPPEIEGIDLQVYTAAWCPDCRRLDRWLAEQAIPHRKVDLEADERAAEYLESETGKRAIPFILVNGQRWVRGYHRELPGRFDPEVLLAELREATRP